eukprot:m.25031 g.25031  ORF g.25031 m.25031 type:complete len:225 (+) comp9678_c0_seq1:183-857(+)
MESLYDQMLVDRQVDSYHAIIVRLIYVARAADTSAVAEEYQRFVDDVKRGGTSVSGILLAHPKCFIHSIELPLERMTEFLDLVKAQELRQDLSHSRVLFMSDSTSPVFIKYDQRHINLTGSKGECSSSDSVEEMATDCVVSLTKLGIFLSEIEPSSYENVLDLLHEKAPTLLSSSAVIEHLSSVAELDSVPRHIERYSEILCVLLDAETAWPHPVTLFPATIHS